MISKRKLFLSSVLCSAIIGFSSISVYAEDVQCAVKPAPNYMNVSALALVENPREYLYKEIKLVAQFDKFSTLGLDYPKALRSSKDYISFLIQRPDVTGEYTIPLSELKLIIDRKKAEELIDLESGNKVEITGKVFAYALNDPWVDVVNVKTLEEVVSK